jgi:hypothetical protein
MRKQEGHLHFYGTESTHTQFDPKTIQNEVITNSIMKL